MLVRQTLLQLCLDNKNIGSGIVTTPDILTGENNVAKKKIDIEKTEAEIEAIEAALNPSATVATGLPDGAVPDIDEISMPADLEPGTISSKQLPEIPAAKISMSDIKNALNNATQEEKLEFAREVGLAPTIGAPKRRRKKVTDEEVRAMAMATGGATHSEDFLPVPAEYIVELGPQAVHAYHQKWLDGEQVKWDNMNDAEVQEQIATATM
jgi:hypothetical protein